MKINGLTAATFTPFNEKGELNLEEIPKIVDYLYDNGIKGLYIIGSTGEGPLLTREEKKAVAKAYVEAANGRMKTFIQVGAACIEESKILANYAESINVDYISSFSPIYFKANDEEALYLSLKEIVSDVKKTPFYFYYIPRFTNKINIIKLLELCDKDFPSFEGIKYTHSEFHEICSIKHRFQDRFKVLFGCDEQLLAGLSFGFKDAVGSTYNFMAPLYNAIIEAFENKNLEEALFLQSKSVLIIDSILRNIGWHGLKVAMNLIGFNCGQCRLPHKKATKEQIKALEKDFKALGFFSFIK